MGMNMDMSGGDNSTMPPHHHPTTSSDHSHNHMMMMMVSANAKAARALPHPPGHRNDQILGLQEDRVCRCCSVTRLCPTLCSSMDCSTPGFPVLHYLPELAHTHIHRVGDAIQPSHPLCPLLLLPSIFPNIRVIFNESAVRIR